MEASEIIEKIDQLETRCPKLGHQVSFSYCRQENAPYPCSRTVGCWHHRFPVETVLRFHLSEEQMRRLFAPPKFRVESLMETIEAAKKRCGYGHSED